MSTKLNPSENIQVEAWLTAMDNHEVVKIVLDYYRNELKLSESELNIMLRTEPTEEEINAFHLYVYKNHISKNKPTQQ